MDNGLEELAESGDPSVLVKYLEGRNEHRGTFVISIEMMDAASVFPGEAYTFTITAAPGDYLSFATTWLWPLPETF